MQIKFKESEKAELKPSLSQVNEIVEAAAGFANAKGGKIIKQIGKGPNTYYILKL